EGLGAPVEGIGRVQEIALARLERVLGRDRSPLFAPHALYGSTPRLYESSSERTVLQISAGAEGRGEWQDGGSRLVSGSGFPRRRSPASPSAPTTRRCARTASPSAPRSSRPRASSSPRTVSSGSSPTGSGSGSPRRPATARPAGGRST